jgi:hypothetical protein
MMRTKIPKTSWYYNKSSRDIVIAELDLTLRSGQVVDLYKLKPTLKPEYLRYSERFGVIQKRVVSGDMLKLDSPPVKPAKIQEGPYVESTQPIEMRVRSCVEVDPSEKDFVENLETEFLQDSATMSEHERALLNDRFAEEIDLDGFADPLAEE